MDASFIPVEVVPSKTPFGLDQLRRSYKTALSAEDAIAAAPAAGAADEVFPFLFLMPISMPESAESATRIDLVYMGSFGAFASSGSLAIGVTYTIFDYHSGDDFVNVGGVNVTGTTFSATGTSPTNWTHGSVLVHPTLPAQKHSSSDAVQSASSSRSKDGALLSSPISVQYYAPTKQLTFMTYGAEGTRGNVDDPIDDIRVITVTIGDTAYSFSGLIPELVAKFFTPQIVGTLQTEEIVPGQYWQNTEGKTKNLGPWVFDVVAGVYIVMYSPGHGYFVGNTLTMTDGTHTAVINVDSVGISRSVVGYSVTSNTFVASTTAPIYASGGSGSGAGFWAVLIS